MLDRQVSLFPFQVLRNAHFVQPGLAALPAEMDEILAS
jgi:hypothetical protein